MTVPSHFSEATFSSSIQSLCEACELNEGGRIRVTFFRSGGGRYTPESNACEWVAEAQSIDTNEFYLNEQGLRVDLYPELRKSIDRLSNFKNLAANIYVQSAIWATENDLEEAMISNVHMNIIESSSSNFFLVSNGVLYTPGLDSGPVGGVMRAAVINVALNHGFKVYECNLSPQEMLRADELFLTNAIQGIQWVVSYRTKRYYNNTARQLTRLINDQLIL